MKCGHLGEFYLLFSQDYPYLVSLGEIGSEFDFSKLDLSNVVELHQEGCKEKFNYENKNDNNLKFVRFLIENNIWLEFYSGIDMNLKLNYKYRSFVYLIITIEI